MAFSSILRRSSSSFAPLAARALRSQRNCHSAIFTSLNQTRIVSSEPRLSPFLPPPRSYSMKRSSSDENLLQFFDSKIQRAEETFEHDQFPEAPVGFPFKIEDKPGLYTITLSREYQGEQIKVEVKLPEGVTSDKHEDHNDDKSSILLLASVAKGNGQFIEFHCTAWLDKLVIDCLAFKNPEITEDEIAYEGPDFQDMDENMRKAFHEYLEIRGITPSTTNFLHEYMISRDSRERLMWLRILRTVVEA